MKSLTRTLCNSINNKSDYITSIRVYTVVCECCQYRALSLATAISARKNPQLPTYIATYLQHNSRLCFTLQISIDASFWIAYHISAPSTYVHTYVLSQYVPYTIASITCIYNILGQAHMCGALTKLNVLWSLYYKLE